MLESRCCSRLISEDYRASVETELPTGFSFLRQEGGKLRQLIAAERIAFVFGDAGSGKSAMGKSTVNTPLNGWKQIWLWPDELEVTTRETECPKMGMDGPPITVLRWTKKQKMCSLLI